MSFAIGIRNATETEKSSQETENCPYMRRIAMEMEIRFISYLLHKHLIFCGAGIQVRMKLTC